jgi:hypothetical protein
LADFISSVNIAGDVEDDDNHDNDDAMLLCVINSDLNFFFRYLLFNDLDEVFVPRNETSLFSLLDARFTEVGAFSISKIFK